MEKNGFKSCMIYIFMIFNDFYKGQALTVSFIAHSSVR